MLKAESYPGVSQIDNPVRQNDLSKNDKTGSGNAANSIYARLRRLEARLDNIELKASALRRDVDRVEKKQSRDNSQPLAPRNTQANPITGLNPDLFGPILEEVAI